MRSDDIFDHQVRTLVSLVQRLEGTKGNDEGHKERVRNFVSFELIGRGSADVIARALGELDDQGADRLNDMVNHCSQTFYRRDEVWNTIAIPVALNWNIQQDSAFRSNRGDDGCLKELAHGIRQCAGSQAVVLDRHFYSATELYRAEARQLHDHLQQLVIGAPRLAPALQSMSLRSVNESSWRTTFLLGSEIIDRKDRSRLQDPGVQDALQSYLHLGADALTGRNSAMFRRGARGETVCHGPLYLRDAIRSGAKALRGYRLRQMLREIAKEEKRVTLYYAFDPMRYAFELLLAGKWLAFGLRWALFSDEVNDNFLKEVELAMVADPMGAAINVVEMDLEELEAKRKVTTFDLFRPRRR
ncbi:hypothetical protein DIC66_13885 [Rhodoferax lacus]|uniref:Uncharacterized protein n=1 Tax=Rhodoferax lacus TaxID=2184758 RepID=A0A3E1RB01_9BURK|nr:hypothetical protein [Rhodoferax lacus]RFO96391.1 hypothetical protein DIC66_13885 [Rhodoferax lacus]